MNAKVLKRNLNDEKFNSNFIKVDIEKKLLKRFERNKKLYSYKNFNQFLNSLIRMFFEGKLVQLEEENFNEVFQCSKSLKRSTTHIVNLVLSKIELVPPKSVKWERRKN